MSAHWQVKTGLAAILGACLILAAAPSQPATRQVLKGHFLPAFARAPLVGSIDPKAKLHLVIGLPVRDIAGLQRLVGLVSDPSSPMYGHYLTPAQFRDWFGPTASDYRAVTAFARSRGLAVTGTHRNGVVLDVTATAQTIEQAFHLKLQRRKRADNTIFYAPDREPALDLNVPILHIQGLDNYIRPKPLLPTARPTPVNRSGSGPFGSLAGFDYRHAYAPGTTLTGAGQSVGLFELDGFYPNDPVRYQNMYTHTNVPIVTVSVAQFNLAAGQNNIEVALDIEMAISMAPGLSSVVVYEAPNSDSPGPTDSIFAAMAYPPPGVPLSMQLGASWSYAIDDTSRQLVAEMAVQGQSFFNSSGDNGAEYGDYETSNLSLPYTTFVGETALNMSGNGTAWASEVAFNNSGGGVLSGVPIPSYQLGVANAANWGSTVNRNIPDVSMVGGFDCCSIVFDNGVSGQRGGGTSLSNALWTGFMALVNQGRGAARAPPVGFFNPLLYAIGATPAAYAADFHDMVGGTNHIPGTNGQGYPVVTGYDLVTGWGTPSGLLSNFPLPTPSPNPNAAACFNLVQSVYSTMQ
jgi:subtilase family serine protease